MASANTIFIATRLEPHEARSLDLLARAKDHSRSAEIREASGRIFGRP
jgi:hypothetical protein